jgi:hypothetical protein
MLIDFRFRIFGETALLVAALIVFVAAAGFLGWAVWNLW